MKSEVSCCEDCLLFSNDENPCCNHPEGLKYEVDDIDSELDFPLEVGIHPKCPLLKGSMEISLTKDVNVLRGNGETGQERFDKALDKWRQKSDVGWY